MINFMKKQMKDKDEVMTNMETGYKRYIDKAKAIVRSVRKNCNKI